MADFNINTSKSPCVEYSCQQRMNDKDNRACRECDARYWYGFALDGCAEALKYFANLDHTTLGISTEPPKNRTQNDRSRRHYEAKYYQASAIIAKERYKKDFATFGEILKYSYDKEKLQSKMTEIYNLSKGTIQYIFSAYNISTTGGMTAAMAETWRRRKAKGKI